MNKHITLAILVSTLLASLPCLSTPGYADDSDHDRAKQALLAGDILPLRAILERIEQTYPGQAVKIEFDDDDNIYTYKIKLLQATGNIIKLKVDASNGHIIRVKEHPTHSEDDD